jgi:8-oxo-dGTP pyrophosphatase MutT (NUDIX family)
MQQFFFAQKAFIVSDRKLLLVQKSEQDPFNPGKWEVPGGRMNFGEDVDQHIRREVAEEVGVQVVPGRPFHVWQWQLARQLEGGDKLDIQIVAVARLCSAESRQIDTGGRVSDDYLGEARWVDFEEVYSYDFIPNMKPVIEQFLSLPEIAAGR